MHWLEKSRSSGIAKLIFNYRMLLLVFALIILCVALLFSVERLSGDLPSVVYDVSRNVLIALLSSVVIVSGIHVYTSHKQAEIIRDEIGSVFDEKLRSHDIHIHGIINIHDAIPHPIIRDNIQSCNEFVILQTWIADLTDIENQIDELCARGGRLRIALLHPLSEFVRLRSQEIRPSHREFVNGIEANITALRSISKTNIEIRFHSHTPSVSIYGFPDRLFVGHYLVGRHAIQGPHLEVIDGFYMKSILAHFEKIWQDAEEFDESIFSRIKEIDFENGKNI